jgi:hypothetical protein
MGHGFTGVAQSDISSVTGPFEVFTETLISLLESHLDIHFVNIFEESNRRILTLLETTDKRMDF